jgi:hypothetical protein
MSRRYTAAEREELTEKVLNYIAVDSMHTNLACRTAGLPVPTFLDWIALDKRLGERYTRARELMLDAKAEALTRLHDEVLTNPQTGALDAASVALLRLRADNEKWLLSKIAPKRYGERVAIAGDNESPLKVENTINASALSSAALAEILAAKASDGTD